MAAMRGVEGKGVRLSKIFAGAGGVLAFIRARLLKPLSPTYPLRKMTGV
jgi:hypothetical protein